MKSCLIIGAGIAGLTAADVLNTNGWNVQLLDKGRGVGGRMATRRIGDSRFDHGAQFFTVRDARFQTQVDRWLNVGWAKPWFTDGGHVRYCGTQGMNGILKHLAAPFDVRIETTVDRILTGKQWLAHVKSGEEFLADALVLTPPAEQTLALLAPCVDRLPANLVSGLKTIAYDPCFALLVTLNGPSNVPTPGYVRPGSGPISFIADNTQKGISSGASALTIHASGDFSRNHFDNDQDGVAKLLLDSATPWLGSEVTNWQIHRWKYSQPTNLFPETCLFTTEPAPLAIAGDGFCGARIEGAFLSGLAAAQRICGIVMS